MTRHRLSRSSVVTSTALILVAFLTGCGGDPGGSDQAPPAASTRSADTPRTIPEWGADDGDAAVAIEPGTYVIPRSPWSVTDFTVTFPTGWTVQYGHVYASNTEEADELGFYAVVVDDIYADSCAPENEATRPVGPGVKDLITALRAQAGGAAVSEPVSATLGGHPATRIDLEIPEHVDVARCRMAPAGLQIWYSEPADKYFVLLDDARASVYVVDVGGRRQVFLTHVGNSASADDRAELQAVLDSIRIGPAS
jgi:hypothetical protein